MSPYAITKNELCAPIVTTAVEDTFYMDETKFAAFYERTSRPLWAYLSRLTGEPTAADDLVQEAYYRLLRVKLPEVNEAQLKSYLFRIATNLVRDEWRKRKTQPGMNSDGLDTAPSTAPEYRHGEQFEHRSLLTRALQKLNPREREMLWLAYVEGSSHKEISDICGVKTNSIRPLLLRARRKLAGMLRGKANV